MTRIKKFVLLKFENEKLISRFWNKSVMGGENSKINKQEGDAY